MRSEEIFERTKSLEMTPINEGRDINKGWGLSMDGDESNNLSAIDGDRYFPDSKDDRRSGHNANGVDRTEEYWEDLERLLATFHHLVDVELPTLLERIEISEARIDTNHQGHEEISRHYFDIRRCFRNMEELLSREDLLNLLDEQGYCDIDENNLDKRFLFFRTIHNSSPGDASNGEANNDALYLRNIFANDLVQLSSMSIFDNVLDDTGIRELHRSLVILAVQRCPTDVKLEDDQISLLLARVLSLIEQESLFILNKIEEERANNQCFRENNQYQQPQHEFEPLQSMISWFNRQVSVERLSRGVFLDCNEAAIALQVPLKFLHEVAIKRQSILSSSKGHSQDIMPPRLVLSLRILIDALLGALNALFERGNGNMDNETNTQVSALSFSEWISKSQHNVDDVSNLGAQVERNSHLCLFRFLDRYALELAEETLHLLRPEQQELSSPSSPKFPSKKDGNKFDVDAKEGHHSNKNNCYDSHHRGDTMNRCKTRMAGDMISQQQRIVKVLQHAAMAANVFSIIQTNGTKSSVSAISADGTTLTSIRLSRYMWQALARFIIDEVDYLDDNKNDQGEQVQKNTYNSREYRIAATDILFRLTKVHVNAILFHDQRNDFGEINGEINSENTRNKLRTPISPPLSEEEFSIVVITILRLLGHPNEYWTESTQRWIASLLRLDGDNNKTDSRMTYNSACVDIGSKLRKVLHATLICSSYVPDTLSFEEQRRMNLSLQSLLLSLPTLPQPKISSRKRKYTEDDSTRSRSDEKSRKDKYAQVTNPWESFWAIRRYNYP